VHTHKYTFVFGALLLVEGEIKKIEMFYFLMSILSNISSALKYFSGSLEADCFARSLLNDF